MKGKYITHGLGHTSSYQCWADMKTRCNNPKSAAYPYYGGRGITYCEKWETFPGFYKDMGEKPEGLTLDRVDNNKGYSKENCRWATRKEQMLNRRPRKLSIIDKHLICGLIDTGMMQKDIADMFGIAETGISKINRTRNNPTKIIRVQKLSPTDRHLICGLLDTGITQKKIAGMFDIVETAICKINVKRR